MSIRRWRLVVLPATILLASARASAQDALLLGSATGAPGGTLSIPVSVRDAVGTLLDESKPPGERIRGLNVKVSVSPASSVAAAAFSVPPPTPGNPCSNATAAPLKLDGPYAGGVVRTTVGWPEAGGPVFTPGAAQPCLSLDLTLSPSATFPVTLSIDPSLATTSLSNADGTRIESALGAGGSALTLSGGLVKASAPSVVVTRSGVALVSGVGGPPPSGTVTLLNVGGAAARVALSADGGVLDVSPALLDLPPGAAGDVTVTARGSALSAPGAFQANLEADSGGRRLRVPVTLTVVPQAPPPGSRAGTRARPDAATVRFAAPAGETPAPRTVTVAVDPSEGTEPVRLVAAIAPGGSWLRLGSELSRPVSPGTPLTLTLSVDRSRRSAEDGPPPLRTLLTLAPAGASDTDAAVVEVIDAEPPAVGPGTGRGGAPPPAGTSSLVPAAVKASGANQSAFFSDGWLRNVTARPVTADLLFTPRDADGLDPARVRKATATLPAATTLRIADVLGSIFSTEGSGTLEVRSASPGALTLRSTVEAVTGGDAALRFGTEIPAVSYRSGVGAGDGELVLPGISDDPERRCNLILAETSGALASVTVTVNGPAGQALGSATYPVPPYGQTQVNGFVKAIVPGLDLSGGWASVAVTGGSGRVFPIATLIDNRSNSFSAVRGSTVSAAAPRPEAESPYYVVPAVVRAQGSALFTSRLSMVNGTARDASLSLTYSYDDLDSGGTRTARAPLTLGPRAALPASVGDDFLTALFGVTGQSRGWVKIEGDVAAITAVAAISTPVDPGDPARGVKTAQVNGFLSTAPEIVAAGGAEHRFAGTEKSIAKRTNLILVEIAGKPVDVVVRATSAIGDVLKELPIAVGAGRYVQVNDVFGPAGLALGDGPFSNVELSIRAVSGAGRVVGLATVNDNLSKNPSVFVLQ